MQPRTIDHPSLRYSRWTNAAERYATDPVALRIDRFQSPHLLKHDEAIFTSVFVFLEQLS